MTTSVQPFEYILSQEIRGGFSLVDEGQEHTEASLTQTATELVSHCEHDKVYLAIVALFQTLKVGIPIERSELFSTLD